MKFYNLGHKTFETDFSWQNGNNFWMDDVIIMKFGQNVKNKILFTYL